jgi:hypothetical protein
MDWAKLMENLIYGGMFIMSMLFLYVVFGLDIPLIVVLSLIYLKIESNNE